MRWLTPVTPATWETEIRKVQVGGQPWAKTIKSYLKIAKAKKCQCCEHLLSKALSSNCSTKKKKRGGEWHCVWHQRALLSASCFEEGEGNWTQCLPGGIFWVYCFLNLFTPGCLEGLAAWGGSRDAQAAFKCGQCPHHTQQPPAALLPHWPLHILPGAPACPIWGPVPI
jgi:hypothetical protein